MPGDDAHGKGTLSVVAILPLVPGDELSEGEWAAHRRSVDYILEMRAGQWRDSPALAFRAESLSFELCISLSFVEQRP